MLGEAQKTHFKHTNSRYDVEVPSILVHLIHVVICTLNFTINLDIYVDIIVHFNLHSS
jgi:hypothetical protein